MQSSFLGFLIPCDTDVSKMLKPSRPSLLPRPKVGPGPTLSMVELPKWFSTESGGLRAA
jgi:hypothetical protein